MESTAEVELDDRRQVRTFETNLTLRDAPWKEVGPVGCGWLMALIP